MMIKAVRWLLLLPLTLAGWYLVMLLGIVLLDLAMAACPPEEVVSGACTAPWMGGVEAGIFYLCSALAATAWVLIPALMAPALKRETAWVAFISGGLVAGMMALHMAAWDDLAVSLSAGVGVAWWVQRARWSASARQAALK